MIGVAIFLLVVQDWNSLVVARMTNSSSSANYLQGVFQGFKNGIPISRRCPSTLKSTCCHVR